jgi:hypothetical protein
MKGQLHSLAAYIAGKETFTSSKHWICLNLNLSLMKQQFVVTQRTQFYRLQKKLGRSSVDKHLAMLRFYENMKSNFL